MAKKHTKKEAVSIAISAARLYRDNFVGKRLLFLVTDKHKKVSATTALMLGDEQQGCCFA